MKKLLLIILLLAGCATAPLNYQASDWEGVRAICEVKADPLNLQVRHQAYTLPTAKQFWKLTYKAADSEDDPRYKYLNAMWTGWIGLVDCKQISREFAAFLIQMEPTWPIGIAETKAGAGGHVVVCCVTSDQGLVYFNQSDLKWGGLSDFFVHTVYIQGNLDWPIKAAKIVDGEVIEF